MISRERQSNILKQLKVNTYVSVDELATKLNVSPMTIRRDLDNLSKAGLVERCYGGALQNNEIDYSTKNIANADTKKIIANRAYKFIQKDDVVFLDAGTTTFDIAELLKNRKDLTIITTDLEIAYLLRKSSVTLYVCGGLLQMKTGCTIGPFARYFLDNLNFDISFIGTACIDDQFFCSTPTVEKADLKRIAVQHSKSSYLVADASKFNKSSFSRVNSLADYSGVISEKILSDTESRKMKELGIVYYVATKEENCD